MTGRRIVLSHLVFQELQLAIKTENLRADTPGVNRRSDSHQGHEQGNQRQQQHEHSVNQHSGPERQIALQERGAGFEIAFGVIIQFETGIEVGGEIPGSLKGAALAVDLRSRLKQQGNQRRMDLLADHQVGSSSKQLGVLWRDIAHQIDDPMRHHYLGQERKAAGIGIGLREAHDAHPRRAQQHLHHRRFRSGNDEGRIYPLLLQLLSGIEAG